MSVHLYFVLECSSRSRSDWMYIESVLSHFYPSRSHSLHPIFMGGKGNILKDKKKIVNETRKGEGEKHVIVCVDKDVDDEDQNAEIANFCKENRFDLVWMNLNVEHVFLDEEDVPSTEKARKAESFLRKRDKILEKMDVGRLSEKEPLKKPGTSNLMLILDKYMKKKLVK